MKKIIHVSLLGGNDVNKTLPPCGAQLGKG